MQTNSEHRNFKGLVQARRRPWGAGGGRRPEWPGIGGAGL